MADDVPMPSFLREMHTTPGMNVPEALVQLTSTVIGYLEGRRCTDLILPLNGSYLPIQFIQKPAWGKTVLEGHNLHFAARDADGIYQFNDQEKFSSLPSNPPIAVEDIRDTGKTEKALRARMLRKDLLLMAVCKKFSTPDSENAYTAGVIENEWALSGGGMNGVDGIDPELTALERLSGKWLTWTDPGITTPAEVASLLNQHTIEYKQYLIDTSIAGPGVMHTEIFRRMLAIETAGKGNWQRQIEIASEPLSKWN